MRVDPVGEGAKWRRMFGQEIYSPFLLAFTEQVDRHRHSAINIINSAINIINALLISWLQCVQDGEQWTSSHVSTFSGMEPSYSLPDNVAMITLQELEDGKVLLRLAHLYEVLDPLFRLSVIMET